MKRRRPIEEFLSDLRPLKKRLTWKEAVLQIFDEYVNPELPLDQILEEVTEICRIRKLTHASLNQSSVKSQLRPLLIEKMNNLRSSGLILGGTQTGHFRLNTDSGQQPLSSGNESVPTENKEKRANQAKKKTKKKVLKSGTLKKRIFEVLDSSRFGLTCSEIHKKCQISTVNSVQVSILDLFNERMVARRRRKTKSGKRGIFEYVRHTKGQRLPDAYETYQFKEEKLPPVSSAILQVLRKHGTAMSASEIVKSKEFKFKDGSVGKKLAILTRQGQGILKKSRKGKSRNLYYSLKPRNSTSSQNEQVHDVQETPHSSTSQSPVSLSMSSEEDYERSTMDYEKDEEWKMNEEESEEEEEEISFPQITETKTVVESMEPKELDDPFSGLVEQYEEFIGGEILPPPLPPSHIENTIIPPTAKVEHRRQTGTEIGTTEDTVLKMLKNCEEGMTTNEIIQKFSGVHGSGLSPLMSKLFRKGLVARRNIGNSKTPFYLYVLIEEGKSLENFAIHDRSENGLIESQKNILSILRKNGRPMSNAEIEASDDLRFRNASGRISELVKLGFVERKKVKKNRSSRKTHFVYSLPNNQTRESSGSFNEVPPPPPPPNSTNHESVSFFSPTGSYEDNVLFKKFHEQKNFSSGNVSSEECHEPTRLSH